MNHFRITIIGDSRVGKTSSVRALIGEPIPDEYTPTIGSELNRVTLTTNEGPVTLDIIDVAGDENNRLYLTVFDNAAADGCIIMVNEQADSLEKWAREAYWFLPINRMVPTYKGDLREPITELLRRITGNKQLTVN